MFQENKLLKKKIEDLNALLEVREVEYNHAVSLMKEKLNLTRKTNENNINNQIIRENDVVFMRKRYNSLNEIYKDKNQKNKDLETKVFDLQMTIEKMKRDKTKQELLINKLTERLEAKIQLPSQSLSARSTNTQYCSKIELTKILKEKYILFINRNRLELELNHSTSQYASLLNELINIKQQNKELIEHEKNLSLVKDVSDNTVDDLKKEIKSYAYNKYNILVKKQLH